MFTTWYNAETGMEQISAILDNIKPEISPYKQSYRLLANSSADLEESRDRKRPIAKTTSEKSGIISRSQAVQSSCCHGDRDVATVTKDFEGRGASCFEGDRISLTDSRAQSSKLDVRQKTKDLLDFIQDDDRLREERKKAKKNKDKYIGMSGDIGGYRSSYSDRYDEEPRTYDTPAAPAPSSRGKRLDDIDEWNNGKKSVAEEAIGKVKDFINKARGFDEPTDYGNDDDLFDEEPSPASKSEYRDNDFEEISSVERTHSYKTEKITNRKSRASRKVDLGAASAYGRDDSDNKSQSETSSGINDFAVAKKQAPVDLLSDSHNSYTPASANGDFADFNPRETEAGSANGDFGDFANFKTGAKSSNSGDFGDFSAPAPPSLPSTPTSISNADLLGNLASGAPPLQPVNATSPPSGPQSPVGLSGATVMGFQAQPMMGQPQPVMGQSQPMMGQAQPMMGQAQPMMGQAQPMMGGGQPMMGGGQPMMMPGMQPMGNMQPMMGQGLPGMGMSSSSQSQASSTASLGNQNNSFMGGGPQVSMPALTPAKSQTASQAGGSTVHSSQAVPAQTEVNKAALPQKWKNPGVDISLDNLSPASKFQKQTAPSMNQLQTGQPAPGGAMMGGQQPMAGGAGMAGLATNMGQMSINQPGGMGVQPNVPNQGMMGVPQGNMGMPQGNMGMPQGNMGMPQGNMGMQSNMASMQQTTMMSATFQQRTNQAFGQLGTIGK